LRELGVGTIYCVGLAYDYCVGSTAVDGAKAGFKTYLVQDATKSVSESSQMEMEARLKEAGVLLLNSDAILGKKE